MIDFLLGVPGKLKTLTDRLTSGRAANLDNLNATVSSRAAAASALSNATWTDARAGKLDKLDKLDNAFQSTDAFVAKPIAGGILGTDQSGVTSSDNGGLGSLSTNSTTFSNVLSVTGAGVLEFLGGSKANSATGSHQIRLTIDGTVIGTYSTGANSVSSVCGGWVIISGTASPGAFGCLVFRSSLLIEHRATISGHTGITVYRARRVA